MTALFLRDAGGRPEDSTPKTRLRQGIGAIGSGQHGPDNLVARKRWFIVTEKANFGCIARQRPERATRRSALKGAYSQSSGRSQLLR